MNHQVRKTAIITGASGGLGLQCAFHLAHDRPTWSVVLACRKPLDRAMAAAEEIKEKTGNMNVDVIELDLADLASIRSFVSEVSARLDDWQDDLATVDKPKGESAMEGEQQKRSALPPLGAVICNAGVQVQNSAKTKDGFELTFGTNHLGHFLLINLILRCVSRDGEPRDSLGSPLRIVLVSSATHDPNKLTGLPPPRYVNAQASAYPSGGDDDDEAIAGRRATSKLCNVLCTYALAKELEKLGWEKLVQVAAYDPGAMPGTGLVREYSPVIRWLWHHVLPLGSRLLPGWATPTKSGRQLASLAADSTFEGRFHAHYFSVSLTSGKSSEDSYNEELQTELWQSSAQLVGLTADESPFDFGS